MTSLDTCTSFCSEDLRQLDLLKIPKHIAIIMDGNRRWAKRKHWPSIMGHREGAEVLTNIVRAAQEIGVHTITAYSFSTENWLRSKEEVRALMRLFEMYLLDKMEPMVQEGVRLETIGDLTRFPESLQDTFALVKERTQCCNKINLVLAVNYGARDEIRRAMGKILALYQSTGMRPEALTETLIAEHLDTSQWGDPELLVRTSGELRLSNFLLWQVSYAEIYVTEKLWPDFSANDLLEAILVYQRREKRAGE